MVIMLKTCCGVLDLKKGSTIVGVINVVADLLLFVMLCMQLIQLEDVSEKDLKKFEGGLTPEQKEIFNKITHEQRQQLMKIGITVTRVVFSGIAVMCVVELICNVLLIVGIRKDLPKLVVPWLIFEIVVLPIFFLLMLSYIIVCFMGGQDFQGQYFTILLVFDTAKMIYFILVVYSLYRNMKGEAVPTDPNRAI